MPHNNPLDNPEFIKNATDRMYAEIFMKQLLVSGAIKWGKYEQWKQSLDT